MKNKADFVEALLKQDIDINTREKHGRTAAILAAEKGYQDILLLLARYGADLTLKDNQGFCAVKMAVYFNRFSVLKTLENLDIDFKPILDELIELGLSL